MSMYVPGVSRDCVKLPLVVEAGCLSPAQRLLCTLRVMLNVTAQVMLAEQSKVCILHTAPICAILCAQGN